ncbi:MAG TPA: hypothetical protein VFC52_04910 [Solirubrobacterales bacterium]|nr:hypothetical protein [Solirubrobacterales bacterium]
MAASVAALALVVGSASGATTRFLVEAFGSSAQPTFPADRGMAYDQGSEELYVIDSTENELRRFNADGSASSFGALGSNAIDGAGTGDETPQEGLSFSFNDEREQIAIDESGEASDGNLYLTQAGSDVVDIFNPEGEYLGQLSESTEGGEFGEPCGVAVDGEGTVYVGDRGDDLIHVFDPAAAVPVNGDSAAESIATLSNPCSLAAGTGATAGFLFANQSSGSAHKLDAATGEVKYEIATSVNTLSVDPGTGHVFIAKSCCSSSAVEEYDASGAAEASLVSSFKPGSTVEGVAANSAEEQVYVARSSTEEVEVYGPAAIVPDVVTEAPSANTGTRATLAGTVNPDGVELDECFFEWSEGSGSVEYTDTAPCAETPAEIGTGASPVAVHADVTGLTPQGESSVNPSIKGKYRYRLVAVNPNATINGSNKSFVTPNTVMAEAATGVTSTEATLNGTVNPDTATISECVFEWGPEKGPFDALQLYPETAPCVPGPGGITGESPVAVEAGISGLHPGTPYAYRLRATYPSGPVIDPNKSNGEGLVVQPLGPSLGGVWSEDVTYTEASLKASVNPEGKATTYLFEWGKTAAYGNETTESSAGSGGSTKEVTAFLDELEPDTTYHYRFVASNADATFEGADRTFTTFQPVANRTDCPNQDFRSGFAASLPDCRAFELVSPLDKEGKDAWFRNEYFGTEFGGTYRLNQVSLDGDKFTYPSVFAIGSQEAGIAYSQNLAERGPDGWSYEGLNSPTSPSGPAGEFFLYSGLPEFMAFSSDLSTAWVRTINGLPLAPGADENTPNLYRHDLETGAYSLITEATPNEASDWGIQFGGASEDGSIEVFGLNDKLTPEAASGTTGYGERQFYVRNDGELHAVGILPNGETFAGQNQVGARGYSFSAGFEGGRDNLHNAVSRDGSRIFWTALSGSIGFEPSGPLYMREHAEQGVVAGECSEPGKACTIAVSESVQPGPSQYWTASPDGDKVLFGVITNSGDAEEALYLFDVETETPTLIANKVFGVAGAAEDLSRVYFVSEEALAAGAIAGQRNLYLYDEGSMTFLTGLTVHDSDQHNRDHPSATAANPQKRAAQATPDGRALVFVSNSTAAAAQVGYDNVDPYFDKPVDQVYRYAAGGQLTCLSCQPSGGRPHGELLNGAGAPEESANPRFTAAWILPYQMEHYQRNFVSDDGQRVFFNSFDALTLGDSNGVQDVYQWEAPGKGDCTEASSSYSVRNGGCVSLVSGGASDEAATFNDATPSGDEVFVRTAGSLLPKDPGSYDVYAARVDGGFPQPHATPECQGDSCQSVPESPRFPSHASAAFHGAGNPQPLRNCSKQGRKAKKLGNRAKRLRRHGKRAMRNGKSAIAKKRNHKATRLAQRARSKSKRAKRCRRANRRAGR